MVLSLLKQLSYTPTMWSHDGTQMELKVLSGPMMHTKLHMHQ
jgi:hypothetical protein